MDERERAADVERVMKGDADALQRLIVHYHLSLHRSVVAALQPDLRGHIEPEDVLQQAYVAAFKGAGNCHFDGPGGFYRWLETVTLSRLADQQRALGRQKRDVAREIRGLPDPATSYPDLVCRLAGSEPTPSRRVAQDEAIAAVMTCLARLSEDQRVVVRERFLEGRPVAEIARRLGKSEAAVHMLCHRGLKALRKLLKPITRFLTRG